MANEKRLIDANAMIAFIERNCCKGCKSYEGIKCRSCEHDDAMAMIEDAPTVDAVEVVRCKDCKHRADLLDCGNYLCNRKMIGMVRPNDFCSFGERERDDAGKDN